MRLLPLLVNENANMLLDVRRYWFDIVSFAVFRTLVLVVICYWLIGSVPVKEPFALADELLVGYILWVYGTLIYYSAVNTIEVMGADGFIQQLLISRNSLPLIITTRVLAYTFHTIVFTVMLAVVAIQLLGRWPSLDYLTLLLVLLLSVPSILGIGFVICGLRLQMGKAYVYATNVIMGTILLVLTVPILDIGDNSLMNLFPYYPAIGMTKNVILQNSQLEVMHLIIVVLNSAVFFVAGLLIYKYLEAVARSRNVIGNY